MCIYVVCVKQHKLLIRGWFGKYQRYEEAKNKKNDIAETERWTCKQKTEDIAQKEKENLGLSFAKHKYTKNTSGTWYDWEVSTCLEDLRVLYISQSFEEIKLMN